VAHSAAGLSAFCHGIEDLGYDTLWIGDRLVLLSTLDVLGDGHRLTFMSKWAPSRHDYRQDA
jgi:hypothetical protein